MAIRTTLSKIIGLAQTAIGGAAIVLAFLAFYNVFNFQTMLGATEADVVFYFSIFLIVGILSIISGIFLFYDQTRGGKYD